MPRLAIRLFGPLQVTLDETPVTAFESDKGRALLAYLAAEAQYPQRRETVVGLLWPDAPEQTARRNLSQALFQLRQIIGDASAVPPFLLITRDTLQFNTFSSHFLDVAEFATLRAAWQLHTHARIETCAECAGHLSQAIALYRGEFLHQFFLPDSETFEEWSAIQRESLQRQMLEALHILTSYQEQRGDYVQAQQYAERQLSIDPWREEAHRQLMRALAFGGDRSAAIAQYETCRRVLTSELDVEPSAETTALVERIRAGQLETPTRPFREHATARSSVTLPAQVTPFVGRHPELAELTQLLHNHDCRLVTLVGPAGIGKTRLALQAAANATPSFPDGVGFVPLVSVNAPEFVASALATVLGLKQTGLVDLSELLSRELANKQMLLVLDNVEHVMPPTSAESQTGVMDLLQQLLAQAPGLKLLLTAHGPLNTPGEWILTVAGLGKDAPELFVQSARRAVRGFIMDVNDVTAIDRICALVGGMPLGVELAAAWVRSLSCNEILSEIERDLNFLAAPSSGVPERHRSLQAVFDYSWRLLPAGEQHALCRLSVFRGGFSREAAAQVCGAGVSTLSGLISRSLLLRTANGRYDMHEVIRQFAAMRLQEQKSASAETQSDAHLAARLHALYFLRVAEESEPELRGPAQSTWLATLEHERDNFRAALDWTLAASEVELGLRLASALTTFWFVHGYYREGRQWLLKLLAASTNEYPGKARAQAMSRAGFLALLQDEQNLAQTLLVEALAASRALDDKLNCAHTLGWLGLLAARSGVEPAARALHQESLALFRELDNKHGISLALNPLGDLALACGDFALARSLYEESIGLLRELGDRNQLAVPLRRLAKVALHQADYETAAALCQESLRLNLAVGDQRGVAACLSGLAAVASAKAQPVLAIQTLAAVSALLAVMATSLMPADQSDYDLSLAALRATLDPGTFERAWSLGLSMTIEQAVAAL